MTVLQRPSASTIVLWIMIMLLLGTVLLAASVY
jgi:hypothetical protein